MRSRSVQRTNKQIEGLGKLLSDQNDKVSREVSDARFLHPESEVCLATKSLTNRPSPPIRREVSLLRSGFVYKKIVLDEHYVFKVLLFNLFMVNNFCFSRKSLS